MLSHRLKQTVRFSQLNRLVTLKLSPYEVNSELSDIRMHRDLAEGTNTLYQNLQDF